MKKFYLSLLMMPVFFSCSEKNAEVVRVSNQAYEVVCDSIYTRMPGTILYQDGVVYWDDPTSFENFMHAVDVEAKTEITAFANRGEGPHDFTANLVSLAPEGGVVLNDLNKPLEMHYQIDRAKKSVTFSAGKYDNDAQATCLLYLDGGRTLYLYPQSEKMFVVKGEGAEQSFGERPIKEDMNNAYDIFQGQIAYQSERNLLVYSNVRFPYLAIYKDREGKGWTLEQELKEEWDYTLQEGRVIFASSSKSGAMELALTDDYIVLLQRDVEVEGTIPYEKHGRGMDSLPRSLFVYDYDLNLRKIVNMPFPMLRLCGDTDTNTVYAMAINPEFELISMDLE